MDNTLLQEGVVMVSNLATVARGLSTKHDWTARSQQRATVGVRHQSPVASVASSSGTPVTCCDTKEHTVENGESSSRRVRRLRVTRALFVQTRSRSRRSSQCINIGLTPRTTASPPPLVLRRRRAPPASARKCATFVDASSDRARPCWRTCARTPANGRTCVASTAARSASLRAARAPTTSEHTRTQHRTSAPCAVDASNTRRCSPSIRASTPAPGPTRVPIARARSAPSADSRCTCGRTLANVRSSVASARWVSTARRASDATSVPSTSARSRFDARSATARSTCPEIYARTCEHTPAKSRSPATCVVCDSRIRARSRATCKHTGLWISAQVRLTWKRQR